MKYCPKCGKAIESGASFCSDCGSKISGKQIITASEINNSGSASSGLGLIEKRDLLTCILLTIFTCGIYGLVWYVQLVNDVNTVTGDDSTSGGTVLLLTIVTCGIYGLIWYYQAGQRMYEAGKKNNVNISDNSAIYLICQIVSAGIIAPILLQLDLNKFAK